MEHVWWRSHLRPLPELGWLAGFGDFWEADQYLPFLSEALDLPPNGTVLELGCARGTFAVRLAQWGFQVTGVEDSAALLERAAAAAREREVDVRFVCQNPRAVADRSSFDGVMVLDFGSRSDAENAELLRTAAAAVQPGGRVVFSTCNPYYWSHQPGVVHRVVAGNDIIRQYRFDFDSGSVISRVRCILQSGERRELPQARFRAYTPPELRQLTAATGLADLRILGEDDRGLPRPEKSPDSLRTPHFHCVALRPLTGESGDGI